MHHFRLFIHEKSSIIIVEPAVSLGACFVFGIGRRGIVCNELVQMLMQFCQLLSVQIKLFLPSSSFPQYFSSIFNYNQNVGQNEVKGKGKGKNKN